MVEQVPGPHGLPFLGNLRDLADEEAPLRALERMAELYGPIYKLQLGKGTTYVVSSVAMAEELCDESRYQKAPPAALSSGKSDPARPYGLFAARNDDPDWGQAHRILMPAFGPMAIEGLYDEMKDIGDQLCLKWARMGSATPISVTDDFTRLTLDTIALCTMDFRFNSFYTETMHPFVGAMVGFLSESGNRVQRPAIVTKFKKAANTKYKEDSDYMYKISKELVKHRRDYPTEKKDLLNAMISGTDPHSGSTMRDDLIIANIITFLIAGHETTSGLLSFAFLNLLQNPSAYFNAQREVDEVLGRGPCKVQDLSKFKYLDAVLRETLRLTPTAPVITKKLAPGCTGERATLGGKYAVGPDTRVIILIGAMQRDPAVYGEDANQFKPERMLGDNFKKLPNAAWKPFGNGVRACIGRAFAWQESLMVMALLLQNFDFQLDDPGYKLHIKQTLTIKPKDLKMRATLRHKMDAKDLEHVLRGTAEQSSGISTISKGLKTTDLSASLNSKPMIILYGSNTGTCTTFAQRLASRAALWGFKASVMDMNAAVNKLPKGPPVIIITASYEGEPPDNAAQYVAWMQKLEPGALTGVQYLVFGCGHADWTATFQRIPILVDSTMARYGATRLAARGSADAAKGNMPADFDDWLATDVWPVIGGGAPSANAQQATKGCLDIEISTQPGISSLRKDVQSGQVLDAKVLTAPGEPEKRHLEIELPSDMTYESGDYLAVLPLNSQASVRRVMSRFELSWDSTMLIKGQDLGTLPMNEAHSVRDVITGHLELFEPASKKILQTCAEYTGDSELKSMINSICSDEDLYKQVILEKRLSTLDLLEQNLSVKLPFGLYLASLSPLRVRYYSISSSPLVCASRCTISFNVISAPSLSGQGTFQGVTGSYLSQLKAGDEIRVSVRPSSKALFHLPLKIAETPLLMICAGTGLAPFRGFVQQRAMQKAATPNRPMAKALLFVGCRSQTKDRLYADEFDQWQKQGVVDIRYSFSREQENSEFCAYVQERIMMDHEDVIKVWEQGARIYVCGSREFVKGIAATARHILRQRLVDTGSAMTDEEMEEGFQKQIADRCATDIFG